MTVFLAAGVTANKVAGKFQVLFFYQLYRLEVDAHGVANSRMAPGCAKNGVVCDMAAFIKEVCRVDATLVKGPDNKPIKDPNTGKPIRQKVPDFDKTDWVRIGEGADLDIFSTEFDKSGYQGNLYNAKIFKNWKGRDNFDDVMSEAEDIGLKAINKLKADGREPADDRINKMTAALKTHADARRYDQAIKITQDFENEIGKKGFTLVYTDPIERPPVPGYKKIDAEQTIDVNKGKKGFHKVEETVRSFVKEKNSAGFSGRHTELIYKTRDIHKHLAEACRND